MVLARTNLEHNRRIATYQLILGTLLVLLGNFIINEQTFVDRHLGLVFTLGLAAFSYYDQNKSLQELEETLI
ncbi:MAG: hypothetical protein HY393_02385 [Candidatus Diapherotrites archaeon]|nr:hypothetical protein [Candidatus Diapherotrites archaeon]